MSATESSNAYSGKLVVVGMVLLGAIAAIVAIVHQWSQTDAAVKYWESNNAAAIRYAENVEVVLLNETKMGEKTPIVVDATQVRGLVHFRQALLEDASFGGVVDAKPNQPDWQYAFRFSDGNKSEVVTVVVDPVRSLIALEGKTTILDASPIAQGLRNFLEDLPRSP